MDLPAEVKIHNDLLGIKGRDGRLIAVQPEGYYEVTATLGEREHRLLLPIASTVLIATEAEDGWDGPRVEVER
jgi:hypothetical protein